jgi:uncharacterized protein (DUF433 family)
LQERWLGGLLAEGTSLGLVLGRGAYTFSVNTLGRITADPEVMGGRPCIRGMRVTVGTVVGLVASGHTREDIIRLYPYLELEDVSEALAYAAWRADEFEVPIASS